MMSKVVSTDYSPPVKVVSGGLKCTALKLLLTIYSVEVVVVVVVVSSSHILITAAGREGRRERERERERESTLLARDSPRR